MPVRGERIPLPDVEPGYFPRLVWARQDDGGDERNGDIGLAVGPGANGYSSQLYVIDARNRILNVDDAGRTTLFVDLNERTPGCQPASPVFDRFHRHGGHLMLADSSCEDELLVQSDGDIRVFGPGGDAEIIGIIADPYGAFGGRVFMYDADGVLYRLNEDGEDAEVFATGLGSVAGVTFGPNGGFGVDMYFTDDAGGRIVRVSPEHDGAPADLWLDLATLEPPITPAGLAISGDGPFGVDIMYVVDTRRQRVVKLNPTARSLGEFVYHATHPKTIVLAEGGMFDGTMLLGDQYGIWVITPEQSADWSGDGVVGFDDFLSVLDAWSDPVTDANRAMNPDRDDFIDWDDALLVLDAWGRTAR